MSPSVRSLEAPSQVDGQVGWYVPPSLPDDELAVVLDTAGVAVFSGANGFALARRARTLRPDAHVLVDPAGYRLVLDSAASSHEAQLYAASVGFVSPGFRFDQGTPLTVVQERFDAQVRWFDGSRGWVSVSVDGHVLRDRTDELVELFNSTTHPIWLVLAASNDPLGLVGAVPALVRILGQVGARVTLARSDVAAIGGMAHGAASASIGLTPTYRHDGLGGGGGGGGAARLPSVFCPALLAWKRVDTLALWAQYHEHLLLRLACPHSCCVGQPITRFEDPRLGGDLLRHNLVSVRETIDQVMGADPHRRPALFHSLCSSAVFDFEWIKSEVPGDVGIPRQLQSWVDLDI